MGVQADGLSSGGLVSSHPAWEGLRSDGGEKRVERDSSRLFAFYLPQYHAIPENDEWWGPGFTEWTNVARGRPNFLGHHQPRIPRELGFYDLTNPSVMPAQIRMAKQYGISGFCFYHYWFAGRRILERPVEQFIASQEDFQFCLCWANENWTRAWDGDERSVLLAQRYGDDVDFYLSVREALRDARYLRVNDEPVLVVYRARDLPDPARSFDRWRDLAVKDGHRGLHVAVVEYYDVDDPADVGADSLIEFPPHRFNGPDFIPMRVPDFCNPGFRGGVVDYRKVIRHAISRPRPGFTRFRGIMPDWDNTPRRQDNPLIVLESDPCWYQAWLEYLRAYTRESARLGQGDLIFVNAWNEWGEGCHLEPDLRWGLSYLEATLRSAYYDPRATTDVIRDRLEGALYESLGKPPPRTVDAGPLPRRSASPEASPRIHHIVEALRGTPAYPLARAIYRGFRRFRA